MATYTRQQIIDIITQTAQSLGIPVPLALAIANQESGLDPNVLGDGGHSVGLFQLNDQGEGHGMSVAARQDPATNARIALTQVANVLRSSPNLSPGQVAAAAQRPKDRAGYAKAIDAALGNKLSPEQYADMSPEGVAYRNNALSGGTNGPGTGTTGYSNIDGFLQSQAPALAAAMNDPEVKSLLQQWGDGGLSDQQFQNQLEQTKWWQSTPQSQRTLLVTQATDPATAAQNVGNQTASVNTLAAKLGVGLTPAQAEQIALDSIKNQWSNDQIQQQVAQYAKYQGDIQYKGEAAVDVNQLRGIYNAMALPVSDQTLNAQLQNVLGGKLTLQQVQDQAASQAATLYASNPQLAEFLKTGQGSVRQWADPYVQKAAQLLGQDPANIDITNPQWSFILKPQTDPNTGQSVGQALSIDGLEQKVKTDPVFGYSKTANGITDYQNLIDKLQQTFTGGGV